MTVTLFVTLKIFGGYEKWLSVRTDSPFCFSEGGLMSVRVKVSDVFFLTPLHLNLISYRNTSIMFYLLSSHFTTLEHSTIHFRININ